MKTLELTQGKVALVDDEDYRWLFQIKWIADRVKHHWYARTSTAEHWKMHRIIMRPPPGMVIDHIDGNGLNNMKNNLRVVYPHQNAMNRRKGSKPTTSRYKGVNFFPLTNKWLARIQLHGTPIFCGYFDNEEDAARAYDQAALKYHGEFARLNFS